MMGYGKDEDENIHPNGLKGSRGMCPRRSVLTL